MFFQKIDVPLEQMNAIAKVIARISVGGDVFILKGDLGAGKTTLVKEIAKSLKSSSEVTSPTFAIVAEYPVDIDDNQNGIEKIIHVDTYRLTHANELYDLGFETIFEPAAVTFIEWGERIVEFIDSNHFVISIDESKQDSRSFTFESYNEIDSSRVENIESALSQAGWRK